MYAKDKTTVVDCREMLRVKVKSLAAEARIIRHEERRTFGWMRNQLHLHRVKDLRRVARATHIAYGLILGHTLEQIEPKCVTPVDWDAVSKMLKKYGPKDQIFVAPPALLKAA